MLAPAKINLALHVTGRRADGYHLLDSVAVFADIGDRITIRSGSGLTLKVSGRFAEHAPADESDLAFRAAAAFFERAALPRAVAIHVEKELPAGAGLGGGSADAAAVLLGLDRLFDQRVPAGELAAIGLKLGADVPMCLQGHALRARGIGEEISGISGWPPLPLLLVWPGRAVSTAAIFAALRSRENPPLAEPPSLTTPDAVAAWLADCRNDLEAPARAAELEIGDVLDALRATDGCLLARMSGSGSACFGLYAEIAAAEEAASHLAVMQPHWWIRATMAA